MEKRKLYEECLSCWCKERGRCAGRYHNVDEIATDSGAVIESSTVTLSDFDGRYPGDAECSKLLVSVEEDGVLYINYAYQYPVRPLATFNKKDMADFVVHLMEKTWFSIFLLRVLIRRIFALKGWTPTLEIDTSRI